MRSIIIKSFVVVSLLGTMAACNKKLDIDPRQSIDLETSFKTEEELDQGIIGCYSIIGGGALYGTNLNMVPELLGAAGTAEWYGTFQSYFDIQEKQMTPNNADVTRTWAAAYRAINIANVIRDILTGADGATIVPDAARRNALIGEAEFIRGIMHFELVRLYAKQYDASTINGLGVPIKLKGAKDQVAASEPVTRGKVGEVYTQVITDLNSAFQKLPANNGVRANRFVALAFLSRVYLQQGNYAAARDAANVVIANGGYSLPGNDLRSPFTSKNTKENVFEIQQNDQNNAGSSNDGLATFYADTETGIGRGDMNVSADFIDEYPVGDKRVAAWYYTGAQYGGIMINKWISFGQNIPVIRIQEMYLTRAECNLRLGTNVGATPAADLALINNPDRTGLPVILVPTVNDIVQQRRLELAFEGHNIHDLKRLRRPTGTFAWNDNMLTLPIPQREIDATRGSLEQNPGY
jgi:hypothetical protein